MHFTVRLAMLPDMIGLPRSEQVVLLSAFEAVPGRFRIIGDSMRIYNFFGGSLFALPIRDSARPQRVCSSVCLSLHSR